jgi:hypothetical protein
MQRAVGHRRDVVRRLSVLLLDIAVGSVLLNQHLANGGEVVEDADQAELQAGVDESVDVRRVQVEPKHGGIPSKRTEISVRGSGRDAATLAFDEGLLHDGDGRVDAAFQPDQRLVGVVGPGVGEAVELLVLRLGGRDRVELLLGRIDSVAALAEPQPAVGISITAADRRSGDLLVLRHRDVDEPADFCQCSVDSAVSTEQDAVHGPDRVGRRVVEPAHAVDRPRHRLHPGDGERDGLGHLVTVQSRDQVTCRAEQP